MKKKSIFSALEGGHLDTSLFGSHLPKGKNGDDNAQDEPSRIPRGKRFGRRDKGLATDRGKTERKTRSDPGL